jgi:hypothetical protein
MKKCKNCSERFEPRFSTLERYCWNPQCKTIEALEKLEKLKKAEIKIDKKRLDKIKNSLVTSSELKKKVQTVFNAYIRQRDKNRPCISCGRKLQSKYDAGHFYSVGNYPALRYHEDNCHAQCVECNHHKGGNLHEYKIGLVQRIGEQKVNELAEIRNTPRKYTMPELYTLLDFYKDKIKKT